MAAAAAAVDAMVAVVVVVVVAVEAADDSVEDGSKNEDLHRKRERRVSVMGGSMGLEVEEDDGVDVGSVDVGSVEVVERLFPFSSFLAILTRQALAAELAAGRFLLTPIFVLLKLDATVVASTSMVRNRKSEGAIKLNP